MVQDAIGLAEYSRSVRLFDRHGRVLVLVLSLPWGEGHVHASPGPPAPPAPHVGLADGLEISRSTAAERRIGRFTARSDGGYDYIDPQRRFRAQIHADGRVEFQEMSRVRDFGVCNSGECAPFGTMGRYLRDPARWRSKFEMSAREVESRIHAPDLAPSQMNIGIGAKFGPSLLSGRLRAEFLRDTSVLRMHLAEKVERRRLDAALARLEARLEEIWSAKNIPFPRRRELIFRLWDESIEVSSPAEPSAQDDDLARAHAERAEHAAIEGRRRILRFIRTHAPAGSTQAYTAEELRRFNARRLSKEAFAPYAGR